MKVPTTALDNWIAESEKLGGPTSPECEQFWRDFTLEYSTHIDVSLDPFEEEYFQQQLDLYSEISGRHLDQSCNELTQFNFDQHVTAANPYAHQPAVRIAEHLNLLTEAVSFARLPSGSHILDLGAGWGLSSEVFAYLGYRVTSVDINHSFVHLINARAQRLGLPIKAVQGAFENFHVTEKVDLCFFYECLHHAIKPWKVIERAASFLAPQGMMIAAAEPVNSIWWPHWGLRLDALSVYCIRKFGWFENGWSLSFIRQCFSRHGFMARSALPSRGAANPILIASMRRYEGSTTPPPDNNLEQLLDKTRFDLEPDHWVAKSSFVIHAPNNSAVSVTLECMNNRPRPLLLKFASRDGYFKEARVKSGRFVLQIRLAEEPVTVLCETWIPGAEIGNGDWRELSIHIIGAAITTEVHPHEPVRRSVLGLLRDTEPCSDQVVIEQRS